MKKRFSHKLAYLYAALFARQRLAGLHYFLLKVALKGLGMLNYYDNNISGESYFISTLLPKIAQNNAPIFFDVGANRGDYSLMLASNFPIAKIFAFEPHPKNFDVLEKIQLPNFFPMKLALSDKIGEMKLYDSAGEDGTVNASLYQDVLISIHQQEVVSYPVQVDTLDSVTSRLKINFIDFLKVDTEGNELAVLLGGQDLIQQNRIGVILFEFNEMNSISGVFFRNFRNLLKNYTFFRLLPHGLLSIPEIPLTSELFAFQNIIAVPNVKVDLLNN